MPAKFIREKVHLSEFDIVVGDRQKLTMIPVANFNKSYMNVGPISLHTHQQTRIVTLTKYHRRVILEN